MIWEEHPIKNATNVQAIASYFKAIQFAPLQGAAFNRGPTRRVKVSRFSVGVISPGVFGTKRLCGHRRGLYVHRCDLESLCSLPYVIGALLGQPQTGFASTLYT